MTPPPAWSPRYSVGNATLDRQRRKLLGLCGRVADCIADEGPGSIRAFHEALHDMCIYAIRHLDHEEALLRKYGYPDLDAHEAEHLAFRERIAWFLHDASRGVIDKMALHRYLIDWWSSHTLESDMQYEPFLRDRSERPVLSIHEACLAG